MLRSCAAHARPRPHGCRPLRGGQTGFFRRLPTSAQQAGEPQALRGQAGLGQRRAQWLGVGQVRQALALQGQHFAVDVFTNLMPRLPRLICFVLAELSTFAFSLLTLWGGWLYLQRAWKFKTPALGLQNIWLFGPVLICFALMAVIALWRIFAVLRHERALR